MFYRIRNLYDCIVTVNGVRRLAKNADQRLTYALGCYSLARALKEPVSDALKRYIIERTVQSDSSNAKEG